MDRVKDTLEEVFLNMDTIEMLKEQNCDMNEIVEMFSETAEYPPELTESLANVKKSLIKSLLLRIQFYLTKGKMDADDIKKNLEAYNKKYGLIVGKLLEGLSGESASEASPEEVVKSESSHAKKKKEKSGKKLPPSPVSEASVASVRSESEKKNKLDDSASVASANSEEEEKEEEEVDKMGKYIAECLEKTNDEDDHLKMSDIYKDFKSWFGKNYEEDPPTRKEVKNYLIEKMGKQVNNGWSYYTFKGGDNSGSESD